MAGGLALAGLTAPRVARAARPVDRANPLARGT